MTDDFASLTDEELNQQLQELLKAAQKTKNQPTDKEQTTRQLAQQRIAKNRLIMAIMQSGKLSQQRNWRGLGNFEDFYNEALQQTFLEIWRKLDSYNSDYPVMAWVNQIFNWRLQDIVDKHRKQGITHIPKQEEPPKVRSLDELTGYIGKKEDMKEEDITEEAQLKEVIENDPEQYLRKETLRDYPRVSLQAILLMLLDGKKWREISEELNVPISSVSSFYQRRLHKIIPYLKKYV